MIARNIVLFLLLLVLPYLYIDLRYFRRKKVWWKRVLLYVPCVAMVAYAIYLAMGRDFIPDNDHIFVLYGFLLLLGFVRLRHHSTVDLHPQFAYRQGMFQTRAQVQKSGTTVAPCQELRQSGGHRQHSPHLGHGWLGFIPRIQQV